MDCEITVKYTSEILRLAVRKYWMKQIGVSGLAMLAVLTCLFVYLLVSGDRSWIFGLFAALFCIWAGVIIFGYYRILNMSLEKFQRMETPEARFQFSNKGIVAEADTGKTELSWKFVDKILQYPKVWLIVVAGGGYITLPTASLDEDLKAFILRMSFVEKNKTNQPPAHI